MAYEFSLSIEALIAAAARLPAPSRQHNRLLLAGPGRAGRDQEFQRDRAGIAELKTRAQRDRQAHAWARVQHFFMVAPRPPDLALTREKIPDFFHCAMYHRGGNRADRQPAMHDARAADLLQKANF